MQELITPAILLKLKDNLEKQGIQIDPDKIKQLESELNILSLTKEHLKKADENLKIINQKSRGRPVCRPLNCSRSFFVLLKLGINLLSQPVLAVYEAGNDVADHIVAGGVDHGGRGIHQVAQGNGDGVSDGHLVGEEDGAQHQLAGTAAAGDAGHGNGGEDGHDDGEDCLTGAEVLAEDAEQEGDLDDGGHGGAVHVHGGAQGQDDVGDVLADAGLFRSFHVGGDGGNGGAGAEGNGCGLEQVLEHHLGAALAAAEAGIDGEEDEHVSKAQYVVDDQGAAVVADQLGAIGSDQVSEETEETDY